MLRLIHILRTHHNTKHSHTLLRHLSTSSSIPLAHPTYFIWSANTSLGKTLVSTGLAASHLLEPSRNFQPSTTPKKFLYIKPIQTGFPTDSDSLFLLNKLSNKLSNHQLLKLSLPAAKLLFENNECGKLVVDEYGMCDATSFSGAEGGAELVCKTLFAWKEAVSPHLAAEMESARVEDSVVVECLRNCIQEFGVDKLEDGFCVVETAGGVASPGPSGTLQCDLYRPFRLPAVLVGDGKLGGISGTISAYETLKLRGYDVVAIILEDQGLGNKQPISSYLRDSVPVLTLPPVPQDMSDDLTEWYNESANIFDSLQEIMLSAHSKRIQRLLDMPKKAGDIFWWPFTQHKLVPKESVTVIDSRCGENFAVFQNNEFITPQFDACASWWTQGPDAVMQIELARDMGYAAARFGHVMFPENVHEPALQCAELLLEGVGKGWASRVFFSDNGSTAIEIALKMAFRKFSCDHGILSDNGRDCKELMVLALKGSYHGDTLGAMEAQAPSSYTGFLQQPWYTGRGFFLDPPTVFMRNNTWHLSLPVGLSSGTLEVEDTTFSLCNEVFCVTRDKSHLAGIYSSYVSQQLTRYSGLKESICIGALLMEPVIQGAGGMHMVDPLFQRVLVNECRKRNIPVILDEVFTGFWRLGVESAIELLHCVPDISCFAKLMTGGIIPLAATLATDAIFDSFLGESKLEALLHGHSYSAHAMGCTAAVKSIKWFRSPQTNFNLAPGVGVLKELWDVKLVKELSAHPAVKRVVALGTLFVLELQAEAINAGYGSLFASSLLQKLREEGVYARPLGNVIYIMCGPCTPPETCRQLLIKLYRQLEEFSQINGK